MLADECPNSQCYGVPLVRPPLSGGGKDPRKECVACGIVYVSEKDSHGWDQLIPMNSVNDALANEKDKSGGNGGDLPSSSSGKGKGKPADLIKAPLIPTARDIAEVYSISHGAVDESSTALHLALQALSQRLTVLSSQPTALEPTAIGHTADAMTKVLQALKELQQVR